MSKFASTLRRCQHSTSQVSTPGSKRWAFSILRMCRARELDVNHPDAIRAAQAVGHQRALSYVSKPLPAKRNEDAMFRRVGGSFGCGKRR